MSRIKVYHSQPLDQNGKCDGVTVENKDDQFSIQVVDLDANGDDLRYSQITIKFPDKAIWTGNIIDLYDLIK